VPAVAILSPATLTPAPAVLSGIVGPDALAALAALLLWRAAGTPLRAAEGDFGIAGRSALASILTGAQWVGAAPWYIVMPLQAWLLLDAALQPWLGLGACGTLAALYSVRFHARLAAAAARLLLVSPGEAIAGALADAALLVARARSGDNKARVCD
jgi:hypothetical protein